MKIEIQKILVLSTGHLTKRVASHFMTYGVGKLYATPMSIMDYEYGCIIRRWTTKKDRNGCEEYRREWSCTPVCLKRAIELAELNGCTMIQFDSDGPICEELKSWDW